MAPMLIMVRNGLPHPSALMLKIELLSGCLFASAKFKLDV